MASYRDLHSKEIPGGVDIGFLDIIAYGTATDSLAAIKKLVYEDKTVTMDQLIDALKCNFEGQEILRQRLLRAPKYGNNDPYADSIAREIDKIYMQFMKVHTKELGIHMDPRMVPVTSHVPFGKAVGATPNGRVAEFPLSDGASASHGADINGPTAVLMSNFYSKNSTYRERGSRLLNLKFTPSTVVGEEGTKKLVDFIRTWCDLKLWFVQFNVVNKETLVEAQEHPDDYRNLIVRVAGYSAYFTDLSTDLQDDIIERTQQESF